MPISADILRLIFIIFGILMILGVYLWEKFQQIETPGENGWREMQSQAMDGMVIPGAAGRLSQGTAHGETRYTGRRTAKPPNLKPDVQPPRKETTPDPEDNYWYSELPSLILQLNIGSKNLQFEGPNIVRAAEAAGMKIDTIGMFHYYVPQENGDDVLLFTLANIVKPGIFPMEKIVEFKTPGLTIFAQLPAPVDGFSLFSTMLDKAKIITKSLKGELQDETHSRLTNQTIEHIYTQITEFQRQEQLGHYRYT
ncbi:hypothetical protein TI04_01430 [Achromatium sp. WMS2]|nr:hypothetical protein TI04_01430 [Achromatium sp. WMS2]